jgi:prepilin-type N-terminal cleavage/methylation domain-containing protein
MNNMSTNRLLQRGFTVQEIVVVVAMVSTLSAIAVPRTLSTVHTLQLSVATTGIKSAIQSTRYLAIMHGYPYQMTLTPSTLSYQLASKPTGATTFSNVGGTVPFTGVNTMVLGASTVLQFQGNGTVSATTGSLTFTVTYSGAVKTIGVSTNGDVSVTP